MIVSTAHAASIALALGDAFWDLKHTHMNEHCKVNPAKQLQRND